MKKHICLLLSIFIIIALTGCSQGNRTANTVIDYGESKSYSQEDREKAVELIINKIGNWESVSKLYNIRYAGDDASNKEKGYNGYSEVMVFLSDFKSARGANAGAFNRNSKYTDWKWILGKNDNGQWELLTWGY